jgi:hypothetical protein
MLAAAKVAFNRAHTLPNSDYSIPERTPDLKARGTGRQSDQTHIPQFGSGTTVEASDIPKLGDQRTATSVKADR